MNYRDIIPLLMFMLLVSSAFAKTIRVSGEVPIYMNISQEEYNQEKRSVMAIIGINITVENVADELTDRKIADQESFQDIIVVANAADDSKKETMVTEVLGMEKDFLDKFAAIDEYELKGQVDDFLNAVQNPFDFSIKEHDVNALFEKKMSADEFFEKLFA